MYTHDCYKALLKKVNEKAQILQKKKERKKYKCIKSNAVDRESIHIISKIKWLICS